MIGLYRVGINYQRLLGGPTELLRKELAKSTSHESKPPVSSGQGIRKSSRIKQSKYQEALLHQEVGIIITPSSLELNTDIPFGDEHEIVEKPSVLVPVTDRLDISETWSPRGVA